MCPVCCWQLKLQWVIHIPELMHTTYSMYGQLSTHSHSYSATCAMETSLCLGPRIRNVTCQVPSEFPSKKCHQKDKLACTALVFFRMLLSRWWRSLHNRHSTVALRWYWYVMSTLVFLIAICAKSIAAHQSLSRVILAPELNWCTEHEGTHSLASGTKSKNSWIVYGFV